ncbi:MAG: DsbA family protein [Rhodospirillales bacterium]|nr:DsbA family protein [Rhodospirillales bacterium]
MMPAWARSAALAFALTVAFAHPSAADAEPAAPSALPDAVLGKADAPVTVIEYSSLGCPHCADFHAQVMPDIKKAFIDTGKVRWIVRDFPLGQLPLAGAVVARCAGPDGYLGLIEVLFRTQESWMGSKDPLGELEKLARVAGIDRHRFNACLDDQALIAAVIGRLREGRDKYGIDGTPSFIVNGEKMVGFVPLATMRTVLERHIDGR